MEQRSLEAILAERLEEFEITMHTRNAERLRTNAEITSDPNEKISLLEEALKLKPDNYDAKLNVAKIYIDQGDFDNGIKHLSEIPNSFENFNVVKLNLAVAYVLKGNASESMDEKIRLYELALKFNPNLDKTRNIISTQYFNKARQLSDKGKYEGAIEYYTKCLTFDPHDSAPHTNIGFCYSKMGLDDEAIREYEKALEINPDNDIAKQNMKNIENRTERKRRESTNRLLELVRKNIAHYEARLDELKVDLSGMKSDLEHDLYNIKYHPCCVRSIRKYINYIDTSISNIDTKVASKLERLSTRLDQSSSPSSTSSVSSSIVDFRRTFNELIRQYNLFVKNYNGDHVVKKGVWPGIMHGHDPPWKGIK